MKTMTLTIPESTPMMAVIRFAAELGCCAEIDADNGNWNFKPVASRAIPRARVVPIKQAEISQAEVNSLQNDSDPAA